MPENSTLVQRRRRKKNCNYSFIVEKNVAVFWIHLCNWSHLILSTQISSVHEHQGIAITSRGNTRGSWYLFPCDRFPASSNLLRCHFSSGPGRDTSKWKHFRYLIGIELKSYELRSRVRILTGIKIRLGALLKEILGLFNVTLYMELIKHLLGQLFLLLTSLGSAEITMYVRETSPYKS